MLIHTDNYLRDVGCDHDAAKRAERKEAYRKATEKAGKAYKDLPI